MEPPDFYGNVQKRHGQSFQGQGNFYPDLSSIQQQNYVAESGMSADSFANSPYGGPGTQGSGYNPYARMGESTFGEGNQYYSNGGEQGLLSSGGRIDR